MGTRLRTLSNLLLELINNLILLLTESLWIGLLSQLYKDSISKVIQLVPCFVLYGSVLGHVSTFVHTFHTYTYVAVCLLMSKACRVFVQFYDCDLKCVESK